MLYADTDGRAQPVRPPWVDHNRGRKPGQFLGDLCCIRANNNYDWRAASLYGGCDNVPNQCFASKSGELLWLSEASRASSGEYDSADSHRKTTQLLPGPWLRVDECHSCV